LCGGNDEEEGIKYASEHGIDVTIDANTSRLERWINEIRGTNE
jgi:hypothetical protein